MVLKSLINLRLCGDDNEIPCENTEILVAAGNYRNKSITAFRCVHIAI
jgi:hypothetical protein